MRTIVCPLCEGTGKRDYPNNFKNIWVILGIVPAPMEERDCLVCKGKGQVGAAGVITLPPKITDDEIALLKLALNGAFYGKNQSVRQAETLGPATTWIDDYDPYDPDTHELGHA